MKLRVLLYRQLFINLGKFSNITDSVTITAPEKISFGERVSIHQYSIIDGIGGIEVGDNVAIGSHCCLITSSHIFTDKNKNIKDQGLDLKKIVISENVWIGSKVVILGNVKIGKNSIIGAGSIVNKNIPDNVVAAGVPCKVIKNR